MSRRVPLGTRISTVAPGGWSSKALPTGDWTESRPRAVGLRSADDGPRMDLTRALVADLCGATERKRQSGPFVGMNDHGVPPPLPQTEDPRLQVSLVLLGCVILAVLLEIAVRAGGADPLRDFAAPDRLQFLELGAESLQARLRDRLSVVLGDAHLKHSCASRPPAAPVAAPTRATHHREARLVVLDASNRRGDDRV